MKNFLLTVKNFIVLHRRAIIIIASSVVGAVIIAGVIVWAVIASQPKIVYQPVDACSLLSGDEAKTLLGIFNNGNDIKPSISKNNASSSCTYADLQQQENDDKVIAISVRSAINDAGIQQNIGDFVTTKPNVNVIDVKDTNNLQYFNQQTGVYNILSDSGKRWIRLSYGIGSDPQGNTLADAEKVAALVLN